MRAIRVFQKPVFHIVIDNCFGKKINRDIFEHITSLKDQFEIAKIGRNKKVIEKYRTNINCYIDLLYSKNGYSVRDGRKDWQDHKKHRARSPLLRAIDTMIEAEWTKDMMDSAPFPLCKFRHANTWSAQISRYGNEGQFYTWHTDNFEDDRRFVTMVYYVHSIPKRFQGGELCLTNGLHSQGKLIGQGEITELEPCNDRMLIFNSRTVHCVKPTRSSDKFREGRFSVNIWVGKKGPLPEDSQL